MAEQDSVQVFISYSRKDSKWRDKLVEMLNIYVHEGAFEVWWDDRMKSGVEWRQEIDKALAAARVGFLLVSVDFLNSEFIMKKELPYLLDRAKNRGLIFMWALVRNCPYHLTPINDYQAVHDPKKPWIRLTEAELEDVLVDIGKRIAEAVASLPPSQLEPTEPTGQAILTAPTGTSEAFVEPLPVTLQPIADTDHSASHGRTLPQSDERARKILTHVNNLDTINDIGSIFMLAGQWPNAIFAFNKLVNLATPMRQDWIAKGYKNLGYSYSQRWHEDRRQADLRMAYNCWTLSKNLYRYRGQQEHAEEMQSWLEDLVKRPHEEPQ